MRVKTGITRRAKHKVILKKAKGYTGRRKSVFKLAKQAILKAGQFAYRDRRNKKRVFRASWIVSINAAVRPYGISYSEFIKKLDDSKIDINRKHLSDIAKNEPDTFKALVEKVK